LQNQEKKYMPFNFKKHSNNASFIDQRVILDSVDRPEKKVIDTKSEVRPLISATEIVSAKARNWADIITDKIKYEAKELKRKNEIIDKQKNLEVKYNAGNRDYKNSTNPDLVYVPAKDEIIYQFKSNLKKLTQGEMGKRYSKLPVIDLQVKQSVLIKDEQIHFEKQNDKCYYCGRDLFSGRFSQSNIHLEHLIDKANWVKEITEGEQLLLKFLQTPAQDILDYDASLNDASYIKSVIQSNSVNSLQNWMYADAECNSSKANLPHYEFINFMEQIQNINTPEIINKNKAIYTDFISVNQNYKGKKPRDVTTSGNAKSYEIYHEYLSIIIENNTENSPENLVSELYLSPGTPPSRILEKIDNLLDILSRAEYKKAINNENFLSRRNSFDSLIRNKKANNFKDKKTLFATKDDCLCGVCGKRISESSPLNLSSSATVFDITESLDDFQWQLVHSDCAARCGNLSVRTLRFLAQQITKYKPEREKITKSLGPDIEGIYKTFKKHLSDLRSRLSFAPAKAAFNFYRFIRRGGR
jgi:hypothetical protein